MKKLLRLFFASLIVVGGLSVGSFAQEGANPALKSINERQQNQLERIRNGKRENDLSRREYGRLAAEQAHIRQMERRLRNSGDDFTRPERARVQRQLNQSSRHIRRAKNN